MRVIVQRVAHAKVTVEGKVTADIQKGYLWLVGITHEDTQAEADKLAKKIAELRIFTDDADKMNLSIKDVGGDIVSVSQFTLYADCKKGRRPSFDKAAKGVIAEPLFEYFNEQLRSYDLKVETGVFGADMKVDLLNDGPVTIILDSKEV